MTGGRDSDDEEPSDHTRSARLLMVAVLALAVAATMVLVLTDSARWLRLGVLAALWAALLGVFLASRFRKSATERESEVADLRSSYELELEREVAARREYELEVEAAARQRVDEAGREDLAELRAELRHLRESLERLTGGEVLVERFALQAQSTRMRSLSEGQRRVVPAGEDSGRLRRSIVAGSSARQSDPAAATELIQRPQPPAPPAPVAPVRREPQRREAPRPVGYRPEPSRPQTSRDGTDDDSRQRRDSAPAAQPTRVARPVQPRQQPVRRPPPPAPEAQQQQQVWPGQAPQAQPQRPGAQRPPQAPQPPRRPVRQYVRHEPAPDDPELSTRLTPPVEPPPAHPQPPRPAPARVAAPVPPPEPMRPEPVRPDPVRVESAGGHRRSAEPPELAEPAGERSRHSADPDVPKDYQSYREWRQTGESDAEITGAHAAGKSVTELLAAHAPADESPRRHRRRAD